MLTNRKSIPLAAAAVLVTALGIEVPSLAAPSGRDAATQTKIVSATKSNRWSPSKMTLARGTRLRFTWNTAFPHNVVKTAGPGGSFSSGALTRKGRKTTPRLRKGSYTFICANPNHTSMKFRARVR